ncbi:GGDEF domain-containing protein [Paraglaciecola hydrolytica]|uniref:diguanylate cyclase n=1 Tax=Paraglaciecola hydrolytica TaxID=1799789 RepID=A0A136A4L9_9ALTE|nr:diguanylate cyclase [Paraglaciecola hydrolytica]KXI30192.1 diguanylate cyclase [Paraglaciecola hydrolytica]
MTQTNKISRINSEDSSVIEKFCTSLANQKMSSFINMINVIAEGIFVVNADGVIEVINPIAAKFFGSSQDALVGQRWFNFLHDRHREHYEYIFLNWKDNKKLPLNHGPKEVLLTRADNSWLEADLSISCLPESLTEGSVLFVGVLHNLTQHKAEYSELRRQASTDHLTGLANRFNLEKTLNKSWNDSIVNAQPISLILIDVDYFKHFNDQFGHVNGDKCLQKIARTIEACLPSSDSLAARYGGEEFAVILPRSHATSATAVARLIQQQINIINFSELGLPSTFRVSVSQGIACEQGGQYRTPEALICAADTALYRAKAEGRNRINVSL